MRMLSARNLDVEGKKMWEAYCRATSLFNNFYAALSMMAFEQFNAAADMVEQTPHWARETKRDINRCRRMWEQYFSRLRVAFEDKYPLYIDYANNCYARLEHDVEILCITIKSVLDRHRLPESDLHARLQTALKLLSECVAFFDRFWEESRRTTGYDNLGTAFRYADLTGLRNAFRLVCDRLSRPYPDLDFAHEHQCRTALTVIVRKMYDMDELDRAAVDAIHMNVGYHPEYGEELEKKRAADEEQEEQERRKREEEEAQREQEERAHLVARLSEKYKVRDERRNQ